METNLDICGFIHSDIPGGFYNLSLFILRSMISAVEPAIILLAELKTFSNIRVPMDADIIFSSIFLGYVNNSQITNAKFFH
jgi:hypothetical protein